MTMGKSFEPSTARTVEPSTLHAWSFRPSIPPTSMPFSESTITGGGQAILTVTRDGDQIYAQLTGQPKFDIFPKSATDYYWKVVNAQVTFIKDASGKVIKAIHHQNGVTIDAPKIQ